MSSVFGKNIKISIFGQSHAPAIGVTLDGIPAGVKIDFDALQGFLARRLRAPQNLPHRAKKPIFRNFFAVW